jgi:hypothetical protein
MTFPVDRGAGGTPDLTDVGDGRGAGEGTGVSVALGAVEQEVGVGEVITVPPGWMGVLDAVAPGWPGARFVPQPVRAIVRAMNSRKTIRSWCLADMPLSFAILGRILTVLLILLLMSNLASASQESLAPSQFDLNSLVAR